MDSDVDEKEFSRVKDYIKDVADESDELADSLDEDEAELKRVANAMLRYDSAVKDVTKNYSK